MTEVNEVLVVQGSVFKALYVNGMAKYGGFADISLRELVEYSPMRLVVKELSSKGEREVTLNGNMPYYVEQFPWDWFADE